MSPSKDFEKRREEALALTQAVVERAQTADRQARQRARSNRSKQRDFASLSDKDKKAALQAADNAIEEKRSAQGLNTATKEHEALEVEAQTLRTINLEEMALKKKKVTRSTGFGIQTSKEEEEDKQNDKLKEIYRRNMVPVIEKWECLIVAAGEVFEPELGKGELDEFFGKVSNPIDVDARLSKWEDEEFEFDAEVKVKEEEEDESEIEVVISDDEEEDEDSDEEMADFIVKEDALGEDEDDDEEVGDVVAKEEVIEDEDNEDNEDDIFEDAE